MGVSNHKSLEYKGYTINAFEERWVKYDGDKKDKSEWQIYKNGEFIMQDHRTASGDKFNGINNIINDAKFNIDRLEIINNKTNFLCQIN